MIYSRLILGDCLEVMRKMIDAGEQVHSVVVDPPYHLTSVVKRFGKEGAAPAQHGTDGLFARQSKGFMGKIWDGGDIAFRPETWRLCWELLPPGGHLLSFGSTRTAHRIAVAIEDAGFEIRDTIAWVYGTGFPKSHDVSKGIDKAFGATGSFGEPKSAAHAGWIGRGRMRGEDNEEGWQRPWMDDPEQVANAARKYKPGSPQAQEWVGWGTALKPGLEPIIVARKPLDGTVAGNVLRYGTGGLNIDGCRVELSEGDDPRLGGKGDWPTATAFNGVTIGSRAGVRVGSSALGRWPANLVHDGSDEVLGAFPSAPGQQGAVRPDSGTGQKTNDIFGKFGHNSNSQPRGDSGSAARFFYTTKATKTDRNEGLTEPSTHPTVKPTDLMRWLCRLVTPPGGVVLDPFMGSGSTGKAAALEGFSFIGIEQDEGYREIARARIAHAGGVVTATGRQEITTALSGWARARRRACVGA